MSAAAMPPVPQKAEGASVDPETVINLDSLKHVGASGASKKEQTLGAIGITALLASSVLGGATIAASLMPVALGVVVGGLAGVGVFGLTQIRPR